VLIAKYTAQSLLILGQTASYLEGKYDRIVANKQVYFNFATSVIITLMNCSSSFDE